MLGASSGLSDPPNAALHAERAGRKVRAAPCNCPLQGLERKARLPLDPGNGRTRWLTRHCGHRGTATSKI
eukprot:16107970-Heterocapsa_arctica.AAC.1